MIARGSKAWKIAVILCAAVSVGCQSVSHTPEPFSYKELLSEPTIDLVGASYLVTSDQTRIAFYRYPAKDNSSATALVIHGGGAYAGAGYQYIAEELADGFSVGTYLMDLRGHGNSEGRRGDAPSVQRIYADLSEMIRYIRADSGHKKLFLIGHSSGAGLLLNYLTYVRDTEADGYVFISPKFGYKSETERYDYAHDPFARTNIGIMALHMLTGNLLFGNTFAVEFNY